MLKLGEIKIGTWSAKPSKLLTRPHVLTHEVVLIATFYATYGLSNGEGLFYSRICQSLQRSSPELASSTKRRGITIHMEALKTVNFLFDVNVYTNW